MHAWEKAAWAVNQEALLTTERKRAAIHFFRVMSFTPLYGPGLFL
jgi:hypothetical protein